MKRTHSLLALTLTLAPLWMGASNCQMAEAGHDRSDEDGAGSGRPDECTVDGATYLLGETFPAADGCNLCTCSSPTSLSCTHDACTGQCAHDDQIYQPGSAWQEECNACSCADGKVSCSRVEGCGRPYTCTSGGKEYAAGETFIDDCRTCLCSDDGTFGCTGDPCSTDPNSCRLGSAAIDSGDTVVCADGCNDCVCREGSWEMSAAECPPLPGIEDCEGGGRTQTSPVYLVDETLAVDIAYEGGCEEHAFKLCYTSFDDADPLQVEIRAVDLTEDDACDGTAITQKVFDLAPLVARLREFSGWDHRVVRLMLDQEGLLFKVPGEAP
jgi:hypothetical protein